jgi:hypothetical protein
VGVMQRFERRLSDIVEGGFARVFRGRVEPVELASALAREADTNKAVGPQRVLVPNVYDISLGKADYERLAPYALTLGDELAVMVSEHAVEQGYSFVGSVNVTLIEAASLSTGAFRIDSRVEANRDAPPTPVPPPASVRPAPVFPPSRGPDSAFPAGMPAVQAPAAAPPIITPPIVAPPLITPLATPAPPIVIPDVFQPEPDPDPPGPRAPAPDPSMTTVMPVEPPAPLALGRLQLPNGDQITLRSDVTVIGRGADADVRISDASVSRRHAKVTVVGRAVVVEDLGSTNGVTLNGRKITRETLSDGDELRLGAATVRYWS